MDNIAIHVQCRTRNAKHNKYFYFYIMTVKTKIAYLSCVFRPPGPCVGMMQPPRMCTGIISSLLADRTLVCPLAIVLVSKP